MCAFSHICNVCVVFGSICFVSCLHVLCSSRWPSLSSFFCSCPAPVFRIYDPPVYSDHFCSSVLCPVYMYCVLLDDQACPPFFVHVRLRSFGSMTPPFILTIPVLFLFILCCFRFEFLFVCFVSCLHVFCLVFCIPSTVHIIRILCPIGIGESGGGVREGQGWLRLVLWCS